MRIGLRELEVSGVLAGARAGRRMLGRLLERVGNDPQEPELLFLDFDGVQVATASFLRESVGRVSGMWFGGAG